MRVELISPPTVAPFAGAVEGHEAFQALSTEIAATCASQLSLAMQQVVLQQHVLALQHKLRLQLQDSSVMSKEAFNPQNLSHRSAPRDANTRARTRQVPATLADTTSTSEGSSPRSTSTTSPLGSPPSCSVGKPPVDLIRAPPGLVAPQIQSQEWSIQHIFGRLRSTCGFPLPSPAIAARTTFGSVGELSLHFIPGATWAATARGAKVSWGAGVRASCRKGQVQRRTSHKQQAAHQEGEAGPVNGALRIKLLSGSSTCAFSLFFVVGSRRHGPFECDFSERAVFEFPFEVDWHNQVANDDTLFIGLEFLTYV